MWFYHRVMSQNDADGMANSVDPDQTAPWAVWSGSALFAQAYLSENLGSLRYSKFSDVQIFKISSLTLNVFMKNPKYMYHHLSQLVRLWHFSSALNSFFKRACHPVGLDVWILVGPFICFHTSCVQTVKALARLPRCTGSPEPSLVACVISTIISWAGSFEKVSTICVPSILNTYHDIKWITQCPSVPRHTIIYIYNS